MVSCKTITIREAGQNFAQVYLFPLGTLNFIEFALKR